MPDSGGGGGGVVGIGRLAGGATTGGGGAVTGIADGMGTADVTEDGGDDTEPGAPAACVSVSARMMDSSRCRTRSRWSVMGGGNASTRCTSDRRYSSEPPGATASILIGRTARPL